MIFEVWTGVVTAADLASYWQGYLADPEVLALRKTLVDLRQCTISFSGKQLSDMIESIVIPALKSLAWKSALLVERPVQFGVSRQYQTFAETYSQDAIFHDENAAVEWLVR